MFFAEVLRELAAVELVQVLAGVGELVGTRHHERVVGNIDDSLESHHLRRVDGGGHDIAHKEELGLGVVYDVMHLVGHKLMENGHGNGPVREHGKKGGSPVGTIAAAECNLVTLHYSGVLEHDVELLYLACHIVILQSTAFIVSQRVTVPVLDDALLYEFIETWYFHVSSISLVIFLN